MEYCLQGHDENSCWNIHAKLYESTGEEKNPKEDKIYHEVTDNKGEQKPEQGFVKNRERMDNK